jgi:hypothetical protein
MESACEKPYEPRESDLPENTTAEDAQRLHIVNQLIMQSPPSQLHQVFSGTKR